MSQPTGRGRGRAGRQQQEAKKPFQITTSSGRASGRAGQSSSSSSSSSSKPSAPPPHAQVPSSHMGEPRAGFSGKSDIPELSKKLGAMKIDKRGAGDGNGNGNGNGDGNGDDSTPSLGRGGIRGRRQIASFDIIRTKPQSCVSKKGDYGRPVELVTNYFKLDTVTNWVLYQYRVDFNVQEDRERVLRAWLAEHKEKLKTAYIFDGTMLFTSQRLTAGNEPLTLTSYRESDKFPVQIDIKLIQQLSYGNAVYLQVFNILVRRCLLHLNLQLVNRNYFDPKASIHLPQHNLEVWPGYVTAIRQYENNVLMCSEITHKIMRTDTALHVLAECTKESRDYRRLFQQNMIGAVVLTDYNNKTYRIDDVDFNLNPLSTFKYKNNEEISLVKYYETRYQIKIRDVRQPLLVSRSSAKDVRAGMDKQCLLVPELCRMTGLTDRMLENRNLMKDLSEITRVMPEMRIRRLKEFNNRLQSEKGIAEDFKRWGMKLNTQLTTVMGRQFPPENMVAGRGITYSAGEEVDWTRSLRSNPMLKNGKFTCFVVICPNRLKRETEEFLSVLKRSADGMSFPIPRPFLMDTRSDGPADMLEAVEVALGKFDPDLIMFVFTTDRADRYAAVKKKCYVDRGVPSQVVLAKSMKAKGVMSIATKIAVQINCKVGGAPWSIRVPSEGVMVIGYDACHDKGSKSKSVGAVVASLNQAMTAWYSAVSHHSSGEELSDSLSLDVCKAIRKYREINGNALPQKIFFYRDGVGEGQINHVYNHEVVVLKKRLTELYGNESWKLAYIIVTKRINTRLFCNGRNPRPGTIVDDVITLPEKYDFFLVSQSVRQGTVSPTSYNVISDNIGWNPNYIQRFTYMMTHLYYNCSATVRVPAPCQYAHKLAFMVSQFLHGDPHANLDTTLYFL